METIYELIKKNSAGKGEAMMWKSTAIISDAIEKNMSAEAREELYDELFGLMSGGHYNECMAKADVEKMYYVGNDAQEHYGPYLTDSVVKEHYDKVSSVIPDYNMWDFYVTLHMIASDNHDLYMKWFPGATQEERIEKYVDAAVNWLNDVDWPEKDKIWAYLH